MYIEAGVAHLVWGLEPMQARQPGWGQHQSTHLPDGAVTTRMGCWGGLCFSSPEIQNFGKELCRAVSVLLSRCGTAVTPGTDGSAPSLGAAHHISSPRRSCRAAQLLQGQGDGFSSAGGRAGTADFPGACFMEISAVLQHPGKGQRCCNKMSLLINNVKSGLCLQSSFIQACLQNIRQRSTSAGNT